MSAPRTWEIETMFSRLTITARPGIIPSLRLEIREAQPDGIETTRMVLDEFEANELHEKLEEAMIAMASPGPTG